MSQYYFPGAENQDFEWLGPYCWNMAEGGLSVFWSRAISENVFFRPAG